MQIRRAAWAAVIATLGLGAPPALAQSGSGAYLAGRQAVYLNDFEAAADYYARALGMDPNNPSLMEHTALANLSVGRLGRALPIAKHMEDEGLRSQVAHMVIVADLITSEDYDAILARDPQSQGIGPLMDGLIEGWALLGEGRVDDALAQFDTVSNQDGLRGFALYHKAMALALVGDYEGAEAIFADEQSGAAMLTRRGAMARAEILSQLGRNQDAIDLLATAFGSGFDPGLSKLADSLITGQPVPFSHVTSVRDGMAEVFFSIAAALNNEANDEYTLIYARIAEHLRPDHIDAILLTASLLDELGQYQLAVAAYRQVPRSSPDHHAAELGRADSLRRAEKTDAAVEVLQQLARDYPELPSVHSALGDLLRQQEDYAGSIPAYDRALDLTEEGARAEWFLHYARGISHERVGDWDNAEADFRKALELNPGQPQVLNYLGYSLVEKQIKLDEALEMIEEAVAVRPDSGYIVDSLGWVLYRLGRYDEAVVHMEKAVELMPVDPVVNDHLGDVYWAVGRYREAEFQWKRALSFVGTAEDTGEADPQRIRRKLAVGLDKVLAEEGAEPLKMAQDRN
nr:tetratricopeptide repeat protein [Thalassococcus sp. S3]